MGACSGGPAKPACDRDRFWRRGVHGARHGNPRDYYQRNPTSATDLGIHKYDDKLEDYSAAAVASEVTASRPSREARGDRPEHAHA
jgi:hypothetical protein